MKFFIVLALAVCTATAFDLRGQVAPAKVPEGRITNGQDADYGQFPYQVGLSLASSFTKRSWCGGSLISEEWILTAAHCTVGVKRVTVYLGATNRNAPQIKYRVYADDIIVHPKYDDYNIVNDISLIKIPFTPLSETISVVKLPSISRSYSSYTGDEVIASGWGKTSDEPTEMIETLQYAELTVASNRVCSKYFGRAVKSSNICVATPDGVSTCQGDSGGPLVLASTGVQIGLTSFGPAAGCTLGKPVVFTRITNYLDWIQEETNLPL